MQVSRKFLPNVRPRYNFIKELHCRRAAAPPPSHQPRQRFARWRKNRKTTQIEPEIGSVCGKVQAVWPKAVQAKGRVGRKVGAAAQLEPDSVKLAWRTSKRTLRGGPGLLFCVVAGDRGRFTFFNFFCFAKARVDGPLDVDIVESMMMIMIIYYKTSVRKAT
jgi:hypothetical protein